MTWKVKVNLPFMIAGPKIHILSQYGDSSFNPGSWMSNRASKLKFAKIDLLSPK